MPGVDPFGPHPTHYHSEGQPPHRPTSGSRPITASKRDKKAAKRFFRRALRREHTRNPRVVITDRLKSYPGALRDELSKLLGSHSKVMFGMGCGGDAKVTHRWGGPIGAPRDWFCSVGHDQSTGHAWAGGYVGDGVTTTNLAGRTLADLITRRDTDLVSLPWVNHESRKWEPEPLRWLSINTMLRLPVNADRYEERTNQTEKWRSKILDHFIGH